MPNLNPAQLNLALFILFFSFLFGSSYNLMLSDDYYDNPDVKTYMAVANGKFEDQSLVRRYRVVVPLMAKVVSMPIEAVHSKIWKNRDQQEAPLRMGFFLVNLILMSLAGLVIFHLCQHFCENMIISFFSALVFLLAGRWGSIISGLPYTDSLYILLISLLWLGVLKKNTRLICVSAIFGFLTKESFVLFLPLFAFAIYRKNTLPIIFSLISGFILAFSVRWFIDSQTQTAMISSVERDLGHLEVIWLSVLRIAQPRGIGELFTVLGVFSFINVIGIFSGKVFWKVVNPKLGLSFWIFAAIIWVHALLSNEVGRMFYIGGAAWAIFMAMTVEHHPLFKRFVKIVRQNIECDKIEKDI